MASPSVAATLAHQGGWDEILLVAGPLVIIALLLLLANRRVSAKLKAVESEQGADGSDQPTEPRPSGDSGST